MIQTLSQNFGKNNKEKMEQIFIEQYKNKDIPKIIKKESFNLIKESDQWKIFFNWKKDFEKKQKDLKLNILIKDAHRLKKQGDLDGALSKYEEYIGLGGDFEKGQEYIQEIMNKMEEIKEIDKIELYDLKAGYYKTYREDNVPGVTFKLKNNSQKELKMVEVTVFFKDDEDVTIFEKKLYPVNVNKFSFRKPNEPLKPNYIWELDEGKFLSIENVPSEWQEGSVIAKVSSIKF